MKPFDLEKVLAGDPVTTRDGRPVTQVTYFDACYSNGDCIFGVVDGRVESWGKHGHYSVLNEHALDLFMAPKVRHGWVVVVPNVDGRPSVWQSMIWTDYKACEERWPDHPKVRIEFEWEAA